MKVIKDTATPFLKSLPMRVDESMERAFEKWLTLVVNKMQNRVPVNTGSLKNSIKWVRSEDGYTLTAGSESVDYAPYIEFGTFKLRAKPFFNPTLHEMEADLINIIYQEMDEIR